MSELVNQTDLAKRLGVSEAAVRKHIRRGLYKAEKDGRFDVETCRALWLANRDPDAALRGLAGGDAVRKSRPEGEASRLPETTLSKARTAAAAVQAQRAHLALQREQGEVIKTEDAYRACRAVVTVVLERLDGAAAQIGARVVGLDAVAAERVARDVLNGARAEIAAMASKIEEVADAGTQTGARGRPLGS